MNNSPFRKVYCFIIILNIIMISCGSSNQLINDEAVKIDTIHISDTLVSNGDTIIRDTIIYKINKYSNPVINENLPDPSVIKASDNFFYLYATEDIRNLPIYKSRDLVNWEFVGTAFSDETRPSPIGTGMLWAPNINIINGVYTLYYSLGFWGQGNKCSIGVALADRPEGPYVDYGKVIHSKEIGIYNCIDPYLMEEDGRLYLFFGSLHGIYAIEMSENGQKVKDGARPVQISGDGVEGSYVYKRDGYYYYFGSAGRCCDGVRSNYHVVCGRSDSLLGPYVTKSGKKLLDGNYDIVLNGNSFVAGPGHHARIIKDDEGQEWMIYHGYLKSDPDNGRVVFLDPIYWKDGWPYMTNGSPSEGNQIPVFNSK